MAIRYIVVALALLLGAGAWSQDKPIKLDTLTTDMTATGPLVFMVPGTLSEVILTCQTAGMLGPTVDYDASDAFDCQISKGHTLDGLVRSWMAFQQQQQRDMQSERLSYLRMLRKVQRNLEGTNKSIPSNGNRRRS